jgi:hypothetical protein
MGTEAKRRPATIVEDACDDDVGARWLVRLEQHLQVFAAEYEAGELQKLRAVLAARRKP